MSRVFFFLSFQWHLQTLRNLREAIDQSCKVSHGSVATAIDITGPGVRLGRFSEVMVLNLCWGEAVKTNTTLLFRALSNLCWGAAVKTNTTFLF